MMDMSAQIRRAAECEQSDLNRRYAAALRAAELLAKLAQALRQQQCTGFVFRLYRNPTLLVRLPDPTTTLEKLIEQGEFSALLTKHQLEARTGQSENGQLCTRLYPEAINLPVIDIVFLRKE